jgi:glyoxylase-like metal-dependent hydrolase (beta-lactamase superfamily II)
MPERRNFLKAATGTLAAAWFKPLGNVEPQVEAPAPKVGGATLPAWEPGVLEIQQINTGRGNAAMILGPDGTSLLIDAGETHTNEAALSPARPNTSRRAGEWIARYVSRQLGRTGRSDLDVMLLTHLHADHVGEVASSSPQSANANYKLTGAADVADAMHVREVIDRGWPDYGYPRPQTDLSALNYVAMANNLASRGTKVQKAIAGSADQLALRHDAARYAQFHARVLSVNGDVWTGEGDHAKAHFMPVNGPSGMALPAENMCCVSLKLEYGAFRYYSGGDLIGDTDYDRYPWHDIETPVAQVCGPVSVAVANHHGYFDACGPGVVRALRPRVWVVPTWHASHPGLNVLANLFSTELYDGERSVFAVNMAAASMLTNDRFSGKLASSDGHVVVRVPAAGDSFTVYVVNARDETGTVVKSFGPFAC